MCHPEKCQPHRSAILKHVQKFSQYAIFLELCHFFMKKKETNFKLLPFMNPCHFWNFQIHSCKIGTKLLLLCHCLDYFFCSKIWIKSKVLMLYFWKLCFWSNRFLQSWHETCTLYSLFYGKSSWWNWHESVKYFVDHFFDQIDYYKNCKKTCNFNLFFIAK